MKLRYVGVTPKVNLKIKAYNELVNIASKTTEHVIVLPFGKFKNGKFEVSKFIIPPQVQTYTLPTIDEVDMLNLLAEPVTPENDGIVLGLGIVCFSTSKIEYPNDSVTISTETSYLNDFMTKYGLYFENGHFLTMIYRPIGGVKASILSMRNELCFDDVDVTNTFEVEESDGLDLIMKTNIKPRAAYNSTPYTTPATTPYKESRKPSELVEKSPSLDDIG
jgi:hypothetical protein